MRMDQKFDTLYFELKEQTNPSLSSSQTFFHKGRRPLVFHCRPIVTTAWNAKSKQKL